MVTVLISLSLFRQIRVAVLGAGKEELVCIPTKFVTRVTTHIATVYYFTTVEVFNELLGIQTSHNYDSIT